MCNVNSRDTGGWVCGDSTFFTIFPINVKLSQNKKLILKKSKDNGYCISSGTGN